MKSSDSLPLRTITRYKVITIARITINFVSFVSFEWRHIDKNHRQFQLEIVNTPNVSIFNRRSIVITNDRIEFLLAENNGAMSGAAGD